MQPVMGPVFETRHLGDVLLSVGKKVVGPDPFYWKDFYEVLLYTWRRWWQALAPEKPFEEFWQGALAAGGTWHQNPAGQISLGLKPVQFPFLAPDAAAAGDKTGLHLTIYPTVQFFDGRGANRPWLQELPDPITQTTWGGWLEIHPETADRLGIAKGDLPRVKTEHGAIEVPALPIRSVAPNTVALPIGQGHRGYGRYADGIPRAGVNA